MHAVGDAGASVSSAPCGRRRRPAGAGCAAGASGGTAAAECSAQRLRIRSLDCALVSPGAPKGLPNVVEPPEMTEGVSFNLANNLW